MKTLLALSLEQWYFVSQIGLFFVAILASLVTVWSVIKSHRPILILKRSKDGDIVLIKNLGNRTAFDIKLFKEGEDNSHKKIPPTLLTGQSHIPPHSSFPILSQSVKETERYLITYRRSRHHIFSRTHHYLESATVPGENWTKVSNDANNAFVASFAKLIKQEQEDTIRKRRLITSNFSIPLEAEELAIEKVKEMSDYFQSRGYEKPLVLDTNELSLNSILTAWGFEIETTKEDIRIKGISRTLIDEWMTPLIWINQGLDNADNFIEIEEVSKNVTMKKKVHGQSSAQEKIPSISLLQNGDEVYYRLNEDY